MGYPPSKTKQKQSQAKAKPSQAKRALCACYYLSTSFFFFILFGSSPSSRCSLAPLKSPLSPAPPPLPSSPLCLLRFTRVVVVVVVVVAHTNAKPNQAENPNTKNARAWGRLKKSSLSRPHRLYRSLPFDSGVVVGVTVPLLAALSLT